MKSFWQMEIREELSKCAESLRATARAGAAAPIGAGERIERGTATRLLVASRRRRDWFTRLFRLKSGSIGRSAGSRWKTLRRRRSSSDEQNLEELAPPIETAKQRLEFLTEEHTGTGSGTISISPRMLGRLFDAHGLAATIRMGKRPPRFAPSFCEEWLIVWRSEKF